MKILNDLKTNLDNLTRLRKPEIGTSPGNGPAKKHILGAANCTHDKFSYW